MKTLKLITFMAIVILAVSCKNDENNNNGGNNDEVSLTMKVNGVDWVGNDNLAGIIAKSNNKASFGGANTLTNETFLVNNVEVLSNGTYGIDPELFQNVSFLNDGSAPKIYQVRTVYPSSRFTFTITKTTEDNLFIDIKGTFSGVLYASASDSIVITEGVFNFK